MKNKFFKIFWLTTLITVYIYLVIGIIHTHIGVMGHFKSLKNICQSIIIPRWCIDTPPSYRRCLFDYGHIWTIIGWPAMYEPVEPDLRGG